MKYFFKMKKLPLPILVLFMWAACNSHSSKYRIKAPDFSISLTEEGNINQIVLANGMSRNFNGENKFENCIITTVSSETAALQKIIFHKHVKDTVQNRECNITESFTPTSNSIRWEVKIEGLGEDWSTPIITALKYGSPDSALFWTTWGSPEQTQPASKWEEQVTAWSNPYQSMPFRKMHLVYGGHFNLGGGYAVPVVSVFDKSLNKGISLAMSPENTLFDMQLTTSANGDIIQTRKYHRISMKQPIIFEMDILVAEPDWRASLGWMTRRYPGFFEPKNKEAGKVSGLGAYSAYEGEVDTAKFKKMGGIINWKASFDFPYMSMFIPPVASDREKWQRFDVTSDGGQLTGIKSYTSIEQMRNYDKRMREHGFQSLSYFNVTEFGGMSKYSDTIVFPFPVLKNGDEKSYLNPTAFIMQHFPDAILYNSFGSVEWGWAMGGKEIMNPKVQFVDRPIRTWGNAVAMDCGDLAYAGFLLNQAKLHIEKLSYSSGICIDRLDWLWQYNWHADDRECMIDGKPVRSLYSSWKSFMPKLGKLMHDADKVIFCNPLINRLDLMSEIDGIYNEYGHFGYNLNLSSFLAFKKPLLAWTPSVKTVLENPDAYFQQHLFMGAFPTAPFPKNDHTINPDPKVEKYYLDYGPMFNQLHEREAVLIPGIIEVLDNKVLANIFKTKNSYIIPVISGKAGAAKVKIKITDEMKQWSKIIAKVIYPGDADTKEISFNNKDGFLTIGLPLHRGCAMVIVSN